jgi:hypothetical protein
MKFWFKKPEKSLLNMDGPSAMRKKNKRMEKNRESGPMKSAVFTHFCLNGNLVYHLQSFYCSLLAKFT